MVAVCADLSPVIVRNVSKKRYRLLTEDNTAVPDHESCEQDEEQNISDDGSDHFDRRAQHCNCSGR